jgi:hypothetical protein
MKTASRMIRYLMLLLTLGVVCVSMSCGGSKATDLSPATTDAKLEDSSSKATSAINGDFAFASPTPADHHWFTNVTTFNAAVSCTGVSGGTWYCIQYRVWEADDDIFYYTNNMNQWSFPQLLPLPEDYYNAVTLEAIFYGYNAVDGLMVLDVETRDFFVNNM